MSHTVYGGQTYNGKNVDDMVDDNRDYGYRCPADEHLFVRVSCICGSEENGRRQALVLFCDKAAFIPLYAAELPGGFDRYYDKYGCLKGEAVEPEVDKFWEQLASIGIKELYGFMEEQLSEQEKTE